MVNIILVGSGHMSIFNGAVTRSLKDTARIFADFLPDLDLSGGRTG